MSEREVAYIKAVVEVDLRQGTLEPWYAEIALSDDGDAYTAPDAPFRYYATFMGEGAWSRESAIENTLKVIGALMGKEAMEAVAPAAMKFKKQRHASRKSIYDPPKISLPIYLEDGRDVPDTSPVPPVTPPEALEAVKKGRQSDE